jgi:DNA-binding transcriptional ArsR family regulator
LSQLQRRPSEATLNLGTVDGRPFTVDANLLATGRTCVLGASGSGKSYAVAVICEELCRNGVPFAIIDTEGEYSGLKEKYEAVWLGEDDNCDLRWGSVSIEELARQAPDIAPLIVDLSETDNPRDKVSNLLTGLYKEVSERREPYLVILEEADRFVPQQGSRLSIFDEIARRGRKRGVGLMVCSQRPSLIDKNVLSQCGNQLIGKLIIQNDLKSVSQFFPGKGIPREPTTLRPGDFYAMGGFSSEPARVTVRERETRHGGITPKISARVVKPFMGTLRTSTATIVPISSEGKRTEAVKLLSFPTPIKEEDVPAIVKRRKSPPLFGKEETVTAVQLYLRPVVEAGVRLRKGVLKKRFETSYFHIDGITGKIVELDGHISEREGFERVLGLKANQIEVLREIKPDSEVSVIDIASKLQEPKSAVGKTVSALESKRLVRVVEYGRKRLARRVVDLPEVKWVDMPLELGELEKGEARVEDARVKEGELREVVRGVWEGADLDSFTVFHYPVYKVELMLKRKKRFVWVDGRTARELVL